jgi:cell division septal protein FtsQ
MFFFRNKNKINERVVLRKKPVTVKKRCEEEHVKASRILFYALTLIFIGVSIYILLFSDYLKIQSISITGLKDLDYDTTMNFVKTQIDGKYLGIITHDNYFAVSGQRLEKSLMDEFKKIKTVKVQKIFPGTLMVEITERNSLILWCTGEQCFIVDDDGDAYAPIALDDPEVQQNKLIKIVDTSARPVDVGEKILSNDYVSYLSELSQEIGKSGFEINDQWSTPSLVAEEVEVVTNEGWHILFSSKIDPEKSLRTLRTFLDETIKDKRGELDYVDLRVENKVFYKLKGEEQSPENQPKDEQKKD